MKELWLYFSLGVLVCGSIALFSEPANTFSEHLLKINNHPTSSPSHQLNNLDESLLVENTCRCRDSLILKDFYEKMHEHGESWVDNNIGETFEWDFTKPMNKWSGIALNSVTLNQDSCVTEIDLYQANLNGNLSNTNIHLLSELEVLRLGVNQIYGGFPAPIIQLSNLKELDLSLNDLTGQLPSNIGDLTQLEILNLAETNLSGLLPPSIGQMALLKVLIIYDNELEGNLNFIENLTQLEIFDASVNALSGSIPDNIDNLQQLEKFDIWENDVDGEIPSTLGNLPNLKELYLNDNQLSGCIPSELGNLNMDSLTHFYLQRNQLEGYFSDNLMGLCALGFSDDHSNSGYNFSNNPSLAWSGDFERFCSGEAAIGAACDDGDGATENEVILEDCSCGELVVVVDCNNFPLSVTLAADTMLCTGNPILLDPIVENCVFCAYEWSTGSTDSTLTIIDAGTYMVTITDMNNCMATATIIAEETEDNTSIDITICAGESYEFGGNTYIATGTYYDTLMTNNCTSIHQLNLSISNEIAIDVQAASCPNIADGLASITIFDCEESPTVSWSGGVETDNDGDNKITLTNLETGRYDITISCGSTCERIETINIPESSVIQWSRFYGGTDIDNGYNMLVDSDSSYLLIGFSKSLVSGERTAQNYDDGSYAGDVWLIQTTANGDLVYDKSYGGMYYDHVWEIIQTPASDYLLGGISNSPPDTGTKTAPNYDNPCMGINGEDCLNGDMWLIKIDENGDCIWDKTYGGQEGEALDFIFPIPDGSGNYLLAGFTDSETLFTESDSGLVTLTAPAHGGFDAILIQIDANGNYMADYRYGGAGFDRFAGIIPIEGGYLLAGQSNSPLPSSSGGNDFWLLRLDNNFNTLWQRAYGGTGDDYNVGQGEKPNFSGLYDNNDNTYTIVGNSNSDANSLGGKSEDSRGGYDFWMITVDGDGNPISDKTIGGDKDDNFIARVTDNDGNYIFGGNSKSDISGDKTSNSVHITADYDDTDLWFVKTTADATCEILCDKTYGGYGSGSDDYLGNFIKTADGNLLAMGHSYSTESSHFADVSADSSDYFLIQFSMPPCADAGQHDTICTNEINLVGNLPNELNGYWESLDESAFELVNDFTIEATNLEAGLHRFSWNLHTSNCLYDADTVSILVLPVVSSIQGADTLTCNQETITLNANSSTTGNNITYQWQNENNETLGNDSTLNVQLPGIYILNVTNATLGCSDMISVEIFQDTIAPTAHAGQDIVLDCGIESIVLDASQSIGDNLIYEWTTLDGNIIANPNTVSPTIASIGTYLLTITNTSTGCIDIDDITVTASEAITNVIDTILCRGESFMVGDSTYTQSGNYTNVLPTEGCDSIVNLSLNVKEINITLTVPEQLDCDTENTTISSTIFLLGDFITYEWKNDENNVLGNNATLAVQNPGIYTLIATHSELGCSDTSSIEVVQNIELPTANAGENRTLDCSQSPLTLNGSLSSEGDHIIYQWTTNDGTIEESATSLFPIVSSAGTYVLSVINTENACTAIDSVIVEAEILEMAMILNVLTDTTICAGDSILYTANLPDQSHGQWTISPPIPILDPFENELLLEDLDAGTFELTWTLSTDDCPEYSTATFDLSIINTSLSLIDDFFSTTNGAPLIRDVSVNDIGITGPITFFNLPNADRLTFTPSEFGIFSLRANVFCRDTLTFNYSVCDVVCEMTCDTATVSVEVLREGCIVPTGFTPNGDGANDELFFPHLNDYPNNELIVFNRWGDPVFEGKPYNNNWNGMFEGKPLPAGTYYYILRLDVGRGEIIYRELTIFR